MNGVTLLCNNINCTMSAGDAFCNCNNLMWSNHVICIAHRHHEEVDFWLIIKKLR